MATGFSGKDVKGIWERQDGETDLGYQRFLDYLNMQPKRDITQLAKIYGVSGSYLRGYASAKEWTRRVAAYDRRMKAEIERASSAETLMQITADVKTNKRWIDEAERMMQETWELRNGLIEKARAMLKFEVGVKSTTKRKAFNSVSEDGTVALNIVSQTDNSPHWTWGDTARMIEMADQLGKASLNLPPDALRILPDFVYELRRHGHDPVDFMKRTIEALRAT